MTDTTITQEAPPETQDAAIDPSEYASAKAHPETGKSGLVDNKLSYYDWLKRQDLPYVQSVLGKDRAALLLKGGLSAERFAALQLDRQFQPMSLAKIARLDEQFIHAAFRKAGLSRYL